MASSCQSSSIVEFQLGVVRNFRNFFRNNIGSFRGGGVRPCSFLVRNKILIFIIDICVLIHLFGFLGGGRSRERRTNIVSKKLR